MDNQDDVRRPMNRRSALHLIGITAAGGLLALAGCKKKDDEDAAPAAAPKAAPAPTAGSGMNCQTQNPSTDDEGKQMRRTVQYMEKSSKPDKHCSVCSQFEAAKFGSCGGCKLFSGGVNPDGYCLSFAAIGAPPVPPPK